MGEYNAERYEPEILPCMRSDLFLSFDGRNLKLSSEKTPGGYSYPAVSGKPENGAFIYTVEQQKKANEGAIPKGLYWISPSELWSNAWYKRGSETAWGQYRITIHPHTRTETYGRGGFFIHGGVSRGSIGCIDLTSHMNKFITDLRDELETSSGSRGTKRQLNCYIELHVTYDEL